MSGTGGRPLPNAVRIADCTSLPCPVLQGHNTVAQIDFWALGGAFTLTPDVWLTIGGTHIDYHVHPDFLNACNHLIGASCPLAINQFATYNFIFPVTTQFPVGTFATIEVQLIDHAFNSVVCGVLDVLVAG